LRADPAADSTASDVRFCSYNGCRHCPGPRTARRHPRQSLAELTGFYLAIDCALHPVQRRAHLCSGRAAMHASDPDACHSGGQRQGNSFAQRNDCRTAGGTDFTGSGFQAAMVRALVSVTPENSRRYSTVADNSPPRFKAARIAAASASETTNMPPIGPLESGRTPPRTATRDRGLLASLTVPAESAPGPGYPPGRFVLW
jgi:hypothetical protein